MNKQLNLIRMRIDDIEENVKDDEYPIKYLLQDIRALYMVVSDLPYIAVQTKLRREENE